MKPVNIGIDLGTTNSLIAKFEHDKVRVFKNPVGQKETLASVVAYRQDRVLVGDKAREHLTKDPVNVFGGFKRKMGTDEKYYVVNLDENVTPVELSALVLKELKHFLQADESPEACVITIPASFDSMQSNATLKAGQLAGFKEVFLLQEPIAASLAFFNAGGSGDTKPAGNWLVYDLGGGTFDVALVRSSADELKVVDHEGNNFLGGLDFDFAIIDQVIIPAIIEATGITNFEEEFRVKFGKYEMLYYQVMYYAEEAKKELSSADATYIEFSAELDGTKYDFSIPVTRARVDEIFQPIIAETIQLLNRILERNHLTAAQVNEIILVGGSTFLPQVRQQLTSQTGITINFSIDPATSIAVGAAYYAANKYYEPTVTAADATLAPGIADELLASVDFNPVNLDIQLSYNRSSRDEEEVMMIMATGDFADHYYRITRADGGFDSGLIHLKAKKTEFLTLLPGMSNHFNFQVFDPTQNEIRKLAKVVNIEQGVYNIDGQPLPYDICVEVDDIENKMTKLEVIFERNSLLPQKRTLYRELSKTIRKGSADSIVINILEGDRNSRATSNLTIGCIEISGKEIQADIVKGSDIEIQLHITESRVLNTAVFLVMTQQEFKNVFAISEKQVSVSRLKDQYTQLEFELMDSIRSFQFNDDKVWEIKANLSMEELELLKPKLFKLKDQDKSDEKYTIAEKIRRISQDADKLGGNERIAGLLENYMHYKEQVKEVIKMADFEKMELEKGYQKVEQSEAGFINSKNVSVIEGKIRQLNDLYWKGLSNTTSFLIAKFIEFKEYDEQAYKDYRAAKSIMKMADTTLEQERYPEFRRHVFSLSGLLVNTHFNHNTEFKGTGIG